MNSHSNEAFVRKNYYGGILHFIPPSYFRAKDIAAKAPVDTAPWNEADGGVGATVVLLSQVLKELWHDWAPVCALGELPSSRWDPCLPPEAPKGVRVISLLLPSSDRWVAEVHHDRNFQRSMCDVSFGKTFKEHSLNIASPQRFPRGLPWMQAKIPNVSPSFKWD